MAEILIPIAAADFDATIAQEKVSVIDFWAPWCGLCRSIAPIMEEIARELKDKITVYKVNVEDEEALTERLGIMGLPAIFIFRKGERKKRLSGALTKEQILNEINLYI